MARLGKPELPWYFWRNRLSRPHYLGYFRRLGFYATYENIIRESFPAQYYAENEQFLGLYPEYDLQARGLQAILEFDAARPKQPPADPVYAK